MKSATERGPTISEVKDNQVANDAVQMDTKGTPTLTNQSVINGETATADATSSVLPVDNMQQGSQYKSNFIADVMASTEVKSKVDGVRDGSSPSDVPLSVTINQLQTGLVLPITVDQVSPVSINQVPVDQVPKMTVNQVPSVTIDQKPPVTVDQAPTVTVDQFPSVTTDQIPPSTVDQVSPVKSNQMPQHHSTNDPKPPVIVPVDTDKPDKLPAEQLPTITVDQGSPIAVDQVLQTTVDQKTVPPVNVDQEPQITVDQLPSTSQVPLASDDQPSQVTVTADHVKVDQIPQVTVNQVPVMDNQIPQGTEQKPPGVVDQASQPAVDQTSPVVMHPVPVLPITVDQDPSAATDQMVSIPDQELDTAIKAAVQTSPTAPSTNHQDVKNQSQPPAAKSAQSKSGKTKKKSGKEGIARLHAQVTLHVIIRMFVIISKYLVATSLTDITPPEASLAAAEANSRYIDGPELQDPCWLPDDIPLINCEEQPIAKTALDQMDIVAVCVVSSIV